MKKEQDPLNFNNTKDIKINQKMIDQVVGQEHAANVIKKAASQRRHVFLIGEPGTGKCVGKDTLLSTTLGPISAENLFQNLISKDVLLTSNDELYTLPKKEIKVHALNKEGKIVSQRILRLYKGKRKKGLQIKTYSGAEVIVSGEHPILSIKDNKLIFKPSEELTEGCWVGLARVLTSNDSYVNELKSILNTDITPRYYQYKGKNNVVCVPIKIPWSLDADLAYFLGIYIAEGRWQGNIKIYNQNKSIQAKIKNILKEKFDYPEQLIELQEDAVYIRKSRSLIEYLHAVYQLPIETTKQSSKKVIPQLLFSAPREVVGAFISGYIDGDGYVSANRGFHATSSSKLLIEQLRLLLLHFEIQSRVKVQKKCATNTIKKHCRTYFTLSIQDCKNLLKLEKMLKLVVDYKQQAFSHYEQKQANTNVDVIPELGGLLYTIKNKVHLTYDGLDMYHATLGKIRHNERQASRGFARSFVEKVEQNISLHNNNQSGSEFSAAVSSFPELETLKLLCNADLFWDKIKEIKLVEDDMYDFEIEGVHNYIVNGGLVVHNSMLGQALAELLPKEKLVDILSFPNPHDENKPLIRVVPAGTGRDLILRSKLEGANMFKNQNIILFFIAILVSVGPYLGYKYKIFPFDQPVIYAASMLTSMALIIGIVMIMNFGKRMGVKAQVPKIIVDNANVDKVAFYDATGAHAGALLGDVLHDPFQTGGLGTPAHERVVAGMIHKANMGVLFIDEIATLEPHTQQELLSSLQNNKYAITGQSERSAGAMVRTEEVPCNYVLVAAGNMETMKNMHPALRSRIRGYGYEVYMKETIEDTPENQFKIAMFVAQEVTNDKKIPHFEKEAVLQIIEEAQRRANRKGHLTLRLRELGGLIRAAGDIALEEKSELVLRKHVLRAKLIAKTLEQQIADRYIERKKEYAVIRVSGKQVGRVNGLAVIGDGASYSGIILPIESEVTPGGKESEIIATGKLGEIAKEAIKNVSAIIKKLFGEDIKGTCDIYVQFLQTYEGVEGDSASIAVATSVISALKKVPIKQNYAMTGSLSVRGEVLPIGGVSAKVEAAIEAGIKLVIVPESNLQDIVLSQDKLKKIKIVPVKNIKEVLTEVMDWSKHRKILEKIKSG
ncbi:ATP-dependent protease LonB [Candidatus Woesearchaeota archaeon]|nr:ATP-dependent protease LonB [Candidatus Woesearchaeota archaeon]